MHICDTCGRPVSVVVPFRSDRGLVNICLSCFQEVRR